MEWPVRVAVFIDGFNLFHSIKIFKKQYYWLDIKSLAKKYLGHNEKLVDVYYFSAIFYKDKKGKFRHQLYMDTLNSTGVHIILGKYQENPTSFDKWANKLLSVSYKWITDTDPTVIATLPVPNRMKYLKSEEKRTDVNMATKIVVDGFKDTYDKAIIITGDSDISPAIWAVKKDFPDKEFVSVIPVGKHGNTIKSACDYDIQMTEADLANSLLPDSINGFERPLKRY